MENIKPNIIQGFNEIVQTIKGIEKQFPEQEHFISFVSFNGMGTKIHHLVDPASSLEELNTSNYHPNASTPLFDAVGFSVLKQQQFLQGKTGYNVLVTILTDGEENASKEFNVVSIKSLVEKLQKEGWTFTYIGTDHDLEKMGRSISISNLKSFSRDTKSMQRLFEDEKMAREAYCMKIRNLEDPNKGFYEK